jgi:hypothetical protein
MKKILLLICLLPFTIQAQNTKDSKFEVSFSYGLSYIDYANYSETSPLNFELPSVGTFIDFNFDFKLPKNRYIGIGVSRQSHSKTVDGGVLVNSANTGLVIDGYNNTHQKLLFDIHFRTVFQNNINFSLGAFYFIDTINGNTIEQDSSGNPFFVIFGEENRTDNFGLVGSLEYFFSLTEYADFGFKGKLYYSFNGIETIAFLPTLRFKL